MLKSVQFANTNPAHFYYPNFMKIEL